MGGRNRGGFRAPTAIGLSLCLGLSPARADTQVFTIVDDPALNQAVAQARADFLAVKPYVSRLDVTLLLPNPDDTWSRGSFNPNTIAYPASCVKLCYLASAMYWERINGHPYDYLDWCVAPMIVNSSNYATGQVVDAVTGAPNYSTGSYDSTFWAWYNQRRFTEVYLSARGLLENQTVMHKTYPTNSGSSPNGAESLAHSYRGGNRMQPKCSASLMLEIVKGAIEPGATAYMRDLLTHNPWGGGSELGFGLPPGSLYENKPGLAYDTLEDIAYVVLPNGRSFVLAAYSNGFSGPEPGHPYPYDGSLLGVFTEMLIDELQLHAGCPPKIQIDNTDPAVNIAGSWSVVTDQSIDYDMYGPSYLATTSQTAATANVTWNLNVPSAGRYEVCVWSPQKTTGTVITYRVYHDAGSTPVTVDQRHFGGRWYQLGNFDFAAGQGVVVLTNQASQSGKYVMADAVKITKWPGDSLFDDDDDGDVDLVDFGGFSACLSGPDAGPLDAPCRNQDADDDDDVDLGDVAAFQAAFSAALRGSAADGS
jgi:protein phosphatase methylesterase 1